MKINIKRKILKLSLASFAIATPIVLSSCSSIKHETFIANYDNALDNSLSFGIAPDYYLSNTYKYNNGQLSHAPYLNEYLNTELTKVVDIKVYDGEETDRKSLSRLSPYTMLVNEWEKADAAEYEGIISHLAYTSMGDTMDARWNSNDKTQDESMKRFYLSENKQPVGDKNSSLYRFGTNDYGVSPQKAADMAANDIDKIYNTDGLFINRSNQINNKLETIITNWNDSAEFKKFLTVNNTTQSPTDNNNTTNTYSNNINLGIISGGTSDNSSTFRLLTPNAVPLLYSGLRGRGLGFNFPEPTDKSFKNETNYIDTWIKASESSTLLTQFKGKFDYLIYIQNLANQSEGKEPDLSGFKELLKTEKQKSFMNSIYPSTYFDIYGPIWGVIGYVHLLDNLRENIIPYFVGTKTNESSINLETFKTEVNKTQINFVKKEDMAIIRQDTDFKTFKEHTY